MAKLIVNPTSSSRREIPLARTLLSIGRDPSNDVVLPDAMVSRRHAVIEYRGSQYFLRDCNSSNGSLVNGDRVSERSLRDGDLVAIGTARLLFRDERDRGGPGQGGASILRRRACVCPSCQADHRKGDLFCRQCGASLAPAAPPKAVCASCGTVVPLPARFCNACGTPLPAEVRAADRRALAAGGTVATRLRRRTPARPRRAGRSRGSPREPALRSRAPRPRRPAPPLVAPAAPEPPPAAAVAPPEPARPSAPAGPAAAAAVLAPAARPAPPRPIRVGPHRPGRCARGAAP